MASGEFETELFKTRLANLKDSQESIQSLSTWCLERRAHHKDIVATWLQVLRQVKVEQRLTLFYLANDVIQYSKRKNFEFVDSWGTSLQRAVTLVRDEKVKHRIMRIFKIWEQRQVYGEEFLVDLNGLLSMMPQKKAEPQTITIPDEFQAPLLISTMRSCAILEKTTDERLRDLRNNKLDIDNAEELRASLKDRSFVEDTEREIDVAVSNMENYIKALEAEIRDRQSLVELLEQADSYYDTQRSEVKIVFNAYRNFGSRVKNLKKKLDELMPLLTSPIPSPDVNAPSPSPDSDIELPENESTVNQSTIIAISPPHMYGSYGQDYDLTALAEQIHDGNDFSPNFSSFMGGNMDFDIRSLFDDKPNPSMNPNDPYDPHEPSDFKNVNPLHENECLDGVNTPGFLKNVHLPDEIISDANKIPGLGDTDILDSPCRVDYPHASTTPLSSRMLPSRTPGNGPVIHSMQHSTPLPSRNIQNSHETVPFLNPNDFDGLNPLQPPPMPPPIFMEDENCYNKLPQKFPTWAPANEQGDKGAKWDEKGKNMNPMWTSEPEKKKIKWSSEVDWNQVNNASWNSETKDLSETPESPPLYEKSGFREPVEYNDIHQQDPLLGNAGDVDHRVIPHPLSLNSSVSHRITKATDVDHRNLISLTGSPANNSSVNDNPASSQSNDALWSSTDQDYRDTKFARQPGQHGDNVESVDMEMSVSDEENEKQKNRVLVNVRPVDRDMRLPPTPAKSQPPPQMDMDMRLLTNPAALIPPPPPPPPPMSQFSGSSTKFIPPLSLPPPFVHDEPIDFHPLKPPPGFQPDFMPGRPDFGQPPGPNFCPDFNFHDNNQVQDSRFTSHGDHREPYNRTDRGRGRGGFPKNCMNPNKQWNNNNNNRRTPQGQASEKPDTMPSFVLLDDDGMPINLPLEQSDDQEEHNIMEKKIAAKSETAPPPLPLMEPPRQLSEQLETLMNVKNVNPPLALGSELKLESMNEGNNGSQDDLNGPPMEIHPMAVFDYGNCSPGLRPRLPFPGWRGNPMRGRGAFRGGPPRSMWNAGESMLQGSPLMSPNPNFAPRRMMGMNRGGPAAFRGGVGFRGRGRGNW